MSTAAPAGRGGPMRFAARAAVAAATALVIVWVAIAVFFNPAWVSFAQGRANAAAYTGWTPAQVDAVTPGIVLEVWFGPGTFEQAVDGMPVFVERERAHMADVRRVVVSFTVLSALGLAVLLAIGLGSRGAPWFWRAVATGAKLLGVGTVAVGIAFFFVFDTAFTIFHGLFFAAGTWTFDPAAARLVQLFPYQFWTETSIAVAAVGLLLTIAVWLLAGRLARRADAAHVPAAAAVTVGG